MDNTEERQPWQQTQEYNSSEGWTAKIREWCCLFADKQSGDKGALRKE